MPMYRVRTVFTGVAGAPYYSNLYFAEEGGTAAQARGAVNAVWANMLAQFRTGLVFTIEQDVPVVDEVTGDVIRVDNGGAAYTGIGTSANDPLPPATQLLMRLRTGAYVNGREIRGRCFIPGMTENNSDQGVPVVGIRSTLDGLFASLVGSTNAQLVVWAKTRATYAVVNSASAWNQWSVLRSRRD